MLHHLGYGKHQSKPGANSRNGYFTKTVTTGDGPLELRTPCDRDGSFEPQLVKKNQTRITGMDNQILSLYAKGMTTREIVAAFKELYDADVSPTLVVLHAPEGQTDVVFTAIISKRVLTVRLTFGEYSEMTESQLFYSNQLFCAQTRGRLLTITEVARHEQFQGELRFLARTTGMQIKF